MIKVNYQNDASFATAFWYQRQHERHHLHEAQIYFLNAITTLISNKENSDSTRLIGGSLLMRNLNEKTRYFKVHFKNFKSFIFVVLCIYY